MGRVAEAQRGREESAGLPLPPERSPGYGLRWRPLGRKPELQGQPGTGP